MNRTLIIFTFLLTTLNCFSTEQIPDLLIIEKDTFYLKSFPLENLFFKKAPFSYGEFNFPHTGCYRGYVATWKISNNKLLLVEMEKIDTTDQKLDIRDYFKRNEYVPKMTGGYVFADWYTDTLKQYGFYNLKGERFYIAGGYWNRKNDKVELVFENGILTYYNITSLDNFETGDTLTQEVSFYRHWLLKPGKTIVKAIIKEKSAKMVRIDIDSYGTNKRTSIKKIEQVLGIRNEQNYWTNPRYWERMKRKNAL